MSVDDEIIIVTTEALLLRLRDLCTNWQFEALLFGGIEARPAGEIVQIYSMMDAWWHRATQDSVMILLYFVPPRPTCHLRMMHDTIDHFLWNPNQPDYVERLAVQVIETLRLKVFTRP